jgi:hypothetical protein
MGNIAVGWLEARNKWIQKLSLGHITFCELDIGKMHPDDFHGIVS